MTELLQSLNDGDLVKVNSANTDREIPIEAALRHMPMVSVSATSFKLRFRDAGKLIRFSSGSAITVTVAPSSEVPFAVNTQIHVLQEGAGQVTFSAGVGVTILAPETLITAKQYALVTLLKLDTDTWLLAGYLEAAA